MFFDLFECFNLFSIFIFYSSVLFLVAFCVFSGPCGRAERDGGGGHARCACCDWRAAHVGSRHAAFDVVRGRPRPWIIGAAFFFSYLVHF
jgi:hypothetical protein